MPISAALLSGLTGATSSRPIIGENQLNLVFWEASQRSNALKRFFGLVYQKNLGGGASFTVDLYKNDVANPDFPQEVAVKTLKLNTDAARDLLNEDVNLYSLSLELQLLTHRPLMAHPNIINLLGVDWNQSKSGIPIPLLIVEYSKFGTVANFLRSYPRLSMRAKGKICLGIADGLKMIHSCGIVHGDMKLANILMFNDEKGGLIAKIADFGCSITEFDPQKRAIYRGTRYYRAPELESNQVSSILDLQRCDVYAFGLCVWEILKNGEQYDEGLEELQRNYDATERLLLESFDIFLDQIFREDLAIGDGTGTRSQGTLSPTHDESTTIFRQIMHSTLQPNPALRFTMTEVVYLLRDTFSPDYQEININLPKLAFKRAPIGIWSVFGYIINIPRDAQEQLVIDLRSSYLNFEKEDQGRALILLSDCYAHGYGVPVQFEEALKYLRLAALTGSLSALAVLPRVMTAITGSGRVATSVSLYTGNPTLSSPESLELDIVEQKLNGAPNNEYYMRKIREMNRFALRKILESRFSVVGIDNQEYKINFGDYVETANTLKSKVDITPTTLLKIENVTPSRDVYLLQFIITCGLLDLLELLALDHTTLNTIVPEQKTQTSNTGSLVLAASVSGQINTLRYLVHSGVSNSIHKGELSLASTHNGLHFLAMFEDDEIEEAAKLLIEGGSDPNLSSDIAILLTSLSPDFPLEVSGPPLDVAISAGDSRAVQILLRLGADPLLTSGPTVGKQDHTCLALAIALHNYEIVEIILDHLSKIQQKPIPNVTTSVSRISPLVHISGTVMGGKGLFWRWMLHGSNYKDACSKTIAICLKYGLSTDTSSGDDVMGGSSALHMAAHTNPCQSYVLESLLKSGANVNSRDVKGVTPLCHCESPGDPHDNEKKTKLLVGYGASINIQDEIGWTPAHHYASRNGTLSLRYLIEQNAFLEARDEYGGTPLHTAINYDACEAARVLIENGADGRNILCHRSKTHNGKTSRRSRLLGSLLNNKGKGTSREQIGRNALHVASGRYQPEIMRLLLHDHGEYFKKPDILNSIDDSGNTPLHWAAANSLPAVRELVTAGADLEIRNASKKISGTALANATGTGRLDTVIFLLENGANVFCRGPPEQKLHSFLNEAIFCQGSRTEQRAQFRSLLTIAKKWIDEFKLLTVQDFAGRTILQYAVFCGEVEAVKALLDIGASVEDLVMSGWDLPQNDWRSFAETSWHTLQMFSGLNVIDYAVKLRGCNITTWRSFVSHEITDEDMASIIEYLGGTGLVLQTKQASSFSSKAFRFLQKKKPQATSRK